MSIRDSDQAYVSVLDLLHTRSLESWDIPTLMREVAGCLGGLGMQLCRLHCGRPILHPLYVAGSYTWYPGNEVELDTYTRVSSNRMPFCKAQFTRYFKVGLSKAVTEFVLDLNPTASPCLSRLRQKVVRTTFYS